MNKIFCIILALIICTPTFSQVKINGIAPQYAGESAIVYTYKEFITKKKEKLDILNFDEQGHFSLSIPTNEVKLIFFTLHSFKIFLYVEPNKSYTLILPPKIEKTTQQKISPYFREKEVISGLKNSEENDLNLLIQQFDSELNTLMKTHFDNLHDQKISTIDSFEISIKNKYQKHDNPFFKHYVKYQLGFLEFLKKSNNPIDLTKKYFINKELLTKNPAYCNLINRIYERYLFNSSGNSKIKTFKNQLHTANTGLELKKIIFQNWETNSQSINELIFLVILRDGYYDGLITLTETKRLLNLSMNFVDGNIKQVAQNFYDNINYLMKGTKAPDFELYDRNDTLLQLSSFNGKYLLLNFSNIHSTPSLAELNTLSEIYSNFKNQLEVISVFDADDYKRVVEFYDEKGYKWSFMFANSNSEIYENYKIYSFPSYVLIDKTGNIIKASAPTIKEGLTDWLKEKLH